MVNYDLRWVSIMVHQNYCGIYENTSVIYFQRNSFPFSLHIDIYVKLFHAVIMHN